MYQTYRRDRRTAIIFLIILSLAGSIILLIIETLLYLALGGSIIAHVVIDILSILYVIGGTLMLSRILEDAGYERTRALKRTFLLLLIQTLIILGALYI
ncbi:MAG: hypothetical protein GXO26_02855 [Crenarchaeota archaeon]|nr:hypothetical protein [Thermoproteota archaeon]